MKAGAKAGSTGGSRLARFATIGAVNTALDTGLFLVLQPHLGTVVGNLVSSSAGMTLSFVLNGRLTFGGRLTPRTAAMFVATTGVTLWLLQPLVIAGVLALVTVPLVVAKLGGVAVSVVVNYAAYRFVVWPTPTPTPTVPPQPRAALRSRRSSAGSENTSRSSAL